MTEFSSHYYFLADIFTILFLQGFCRFWYFIIKRQLDNYAITHSSNVDFDFQAKWLSFAKTWEMSKKVAFQRHLNAVLKEQKMSVNHETRYYIHFHWILIFCFRQQTTDISSNAHQSVQHLYKVKILYIRVGGKQL